MSKETKFQCITIITQLVLVGVVIWYTVETMRIRRQNQEQLSLLRMQAGMSVTPDLVCDVEEIVEYPSRRGGQPVTEMKLFLCTIRNKGGNLARDVSLFAYDFMTQKFHEGVSYTEVLNPKEVKLNVTMPSSREEIKRKIIELYETSSTFVFSQLKPEQYSYVAVVYEDMLYKTWVYKRPFVVGEDGGIEYTGTVLVREPDGIDESTTESS